MKISVITPVYNGMPQLPRCIGSVKSQLNNNIEIEHIIQDGLSLDNTVNFLSEFDDLNKNNKNYKSYYFHYESNKDKGMYDAINKGWEKATGDIYCWLNHDEQYLPETLLKVTEHFKKNPDVDVIYGNMIVVDPDGNPLAARREIPLRSSYIKHDFLYAISCTIFFRANLFDEGILKFNDNLICAGDLDLMLKIMNSGKKIEHINRYFSLFGVDGSNLSVINRNILDNEIEKIQRINGASEYKIIRLFYKILRRMERLFKGCYKTDSILFKYILNENSDYVYRSGKNISFRFTYDHVNKIMNKSNTL
ncbi:MAG: glycosyltransferase [Pontiellaceae bacterium]